MMFFIIAILIIVALGVVMSVGIWMTTSLAKVGQVAVMLALIAGAGVLCLIVVAFSISNTQFFAPSSASSSSLGDVSPEEVRRILAEHQDELDAKYIEEHASEVQEVLELLSGTWATVEADGSPITVTFKNQKTGPTFHFAHDAKPPSISIPLKPIAFKINASPNDGLRRFGDGKVQPEYHKIGNFAEDVEVFIKIVKPSSETTEKWRVVTLTGNQLEIVVKDSLNPYKNVVKNSSDPNRLVRLTRGGPSK